MSAKIAGKGAMTLCCAYDEANQPDLPSALIFFCPMRVSEASVSEAL